MDKTGYFDALTAYSRNPSQEIPPILEQYLNGVAKNGETVFHWPLLKPLIFGKMEQVINELRKDLSSEIIPERPNVENVPFDVMHARIVETLQKFNGAPFTIQRLCELLIDPRKNYKRSDKFLRGLEKNVLVVSTVDPFGRKVVSESGSKHLVNGLDTNGSLLFPRDSSISSNLPPVPDWVTISAPVSATDLSDETQRQLPSQDPTVPTNDGSGCLEYGDQGEHPLAVQTEEVIDKILVKDVQDNGAEEEEEDGSLGGDDTSTSSSSSSSSELSTSDTGEGSDGATTTVASAGNAKASPWAFVTGEGNRKTSPSGVDSPSSSSSSSNEKSEQIQELPQSQPPASGQEESLSSNAEASSKQELEAEKIEQPDLCAQSMIPESSSDVASVQQESFNDSTSSGSEFTQKPIGSIPNSENYRQQTIFDNEDSLNIRLKSENKSDNVLSESEFKNASTTASLESENDEAVIKTLQLGNEDMAVSMNTESEIESDDLINMGHKATVQNDGSNILNPEKDDSSNMTECPSENVNYGLNVRPELNSSAAGIDLVLPCSKQTISSTKRTYAEVVTSSNVGAFAQDSTSPDSITGNDNMAGLERLVDSVHPSSSVLSPKSSAQTSPTTTNKSPKLVSSTVNSSSYSEEPKSKRQRLSDESPSHPASKTLNITTSTEAEPSPKNTSAESDPSADTTFDSVAANPLDTIWKMNSEVHEPMEGVSCDGNEAESTSQDIELEDNSHTHDVRDDVPSPPSSSDSQGFDVTSGALHRISSEEKQESSIQETQPQELDEIPSDISEDKKQPEDPAHQRDILN